MRENYSIKSAWSLGRTGAGSVVALAFLALSGLLSSSSGAAGGATQQPNIVIIYADDMGYGDLHCQNPDSKIPTPHLDRLAEEGMRFTDAHSSSGICSPSRFALLTGQYHWRRTHNIVESFGSPLFKEGDITLPGIFKDAGYATACIGKWHLGWNFNFLRKPTAERTYWGKTQKVYLPEDLDWSAPLTGGPRDRGFDYYFGDGTVNFPPYAWVENDRFLEVPTDFFEFNQFQSEPKEGDWDSRPGPMVKGWDPYKVLPRITEKAVEWIHRQEQGHPFLLYFALTSPHEPIIPNDEFLGKSEAGGYGDFVYQSDWVAGQVLQALKDKGFEEKTIVVFSSDNGPEKSAFERALKTGHFSMGEFRGLKRDVWEGGHRVPFIVKWPGRIHAGTISNEVISQVDLMATLAAAAGVAMPNEAAPDSYNFLPVWLGEDYRSPVREATVHNTTKGLWGLRKGRWLYINRPSGEISKMPESFKRARGYADFETAGLLFDLENDPGQRHNLFAEHPEIIKELDERLTTILKSERTSPRD